ncbi:hypothetical protein LVD15_01750 [Fulvivirga maritima]|uniref:DUF3108 domain-containing protein n=1 Tax=Fulvivirga maritima TaxID=2904247 RepID=UPI001F3DFE38|nr:hypothetical protein [Fulvivirga maritima]UII27175.1 hypothetical protein LVD15_01750 [Fulvivirga maritima]
MKKRILVAAAVLMSTFSFAQEKLTPANVKFETTKIKDQSYRQKWVMIRDTINIELGNIQVDVQKNDDELTLVTHVQLNQMKEVDWVDSAVAKLPNLAPKYHSSYNPQRDMVLNFGTVITGYYQNNTTGETTLINQPEDELYFDSNIYTNFIPWLPLKKGYKAQISIYDYNPAKSGLMTVTITGVEKGEYQTEQSGKRPVWIVKLTDNIAGSENKQKIYVDRKTSEIWLQEITSGDRVMQMIRVEE